jgi:hypothetical protein
MKLFLKIFLIAVFTLSQFLLAQNKFVIGVGGNYNLPVGSLADRMNGAFGGWFYAGKQVSDDWTWVGKFEYFKLTDVNEENMYKIVETNINGVNQNLRFELPGINMELSVMGFTAEAKYKLFKSDIFETDLSLGFGFYYWNYDRGNYTDSLLADTTGSGDLVVVDIINVPALNQKDWSGGLNAGLDLNVNVFEPVWLNLSVNYKLIIAELWPTLDLNLENVSGLQFFDFRAGINLRL